MKALKASLFLFSPLLLPTYALLIFMQSYKLFEFLPPQIKIIYLQYIFLGTCGLPLISLLILLWQKSISSLIPNTKEERVIPYLSYLIFTGMLSSIMWKANLFAEIKLITFSAFLICLLLFIFNFKIKLSTFAASMGGFTAFLIILSLSKSVYLLFFVIFAILSSGFVCYMQLALNNHKPNETYYGYLLGVIATFSVYWILLAL